MSNPDEIEQVQITEEEQWNNEEEQEFNEEEQEFNDDDQNYVGDSIDGDSPTLIISYSHDTDVDTTDYLSRYISLCEGLFIGFEFFRENYTKFTIKIPNTILPLSVCSISGFLHCPTLVECTFDLQQTSPWDTRPVIIDCINEYYGLNFPGSILLKNRINNFFKFGYAPPKKYRCQCYVLAPQEIRKPSNSEELINSLLNEGFTRKQAQRALEFCSFDIKRAREYLIFGVINNEPLPFDISLSENPIFYLTLEMCEAFFDMSDCCCVCGESLGLSGLKPACCSKDICNFSFLNLGIGSHIITEIKRDPLASDLIIALAAAACFAPPQPPIFDPSPSKANVKFDRKFFDTLPSMKQICAKCNTDADLRSFLGDYNYEIFRFFILASKAQLTTIPDSLKVDVGVQGTQFFISSVSTELELIFRQKRKQYGVQWLWHGSLTDRWYRILHTGLKDFGKTEFTTHGPPYFGKGIYMSESFHYSYWYCTAAPNKYKESALPKNLLIISLVENANTPGLTKPVTEHEYTQKDDQACITRILFVMDPTNKNNQKLDTDTIAKPPKVHDFQEILLANIKKEY